MPEFNSDIKPLLSVFRYSVRFLSPTDNKLSEGLTVRQFFFTFPFNSLEMFSLCMMVLMIITNFFWRMSIYLWLSSGCKYSGGVVDPVVRWNELVLETVKQLGWPGASCGNDCGHGREELGHWAYRQFH